MLTILAFLVLAPLALLYVQLPKFGKTPSGERLAKAVRSKNYHKDSFRNLSVTPNLTEGVSMFSVLKEFFLVRNERRKPKGPLPVQKTDLLNLKPDEDVLIWFGHSSYFIQIDGKKIIVDPVLSGAASPIRFTTRSFNNSDIYSPEEIPDVDYLFITHDHWDHLDYQTVMRLKFGRVICGLGTGQHFDRWGVPAHKIVELDWFDHFTPNPGITIDTVPARHFSGRGFSRNKALWLSFVLQTPTMKIFIGGDSGYDSHFAAAGEKHGPFDLAILENGQYDKAWKYIHMMPDEVIKASKELRAAKLLPVHSGKFALANHAWDEPLQKISALAEKASVLLLTPMIGQKVPLKSETQRFEKWWVGVD